MTTQIEVDVTVTNVKQHPTHYYLYGNFKYEQTTPGPNYVKPNGNIILTPLLDDAEIVLNWKTPLVEIDGTEYEAALLSPNNDSIRLAKGQGMKPIVGAPTQGHQVTVPPGNGTSSLKILDLNTNGEKYTYNLVIRVEKDGGLTLVDDPIIENKSRTRFMATPAVEAEPAIPSDADGPATPAMPATPAIPPDPKDPEDG